VVAVRVGDRLAWLLLLLLLSLAEFGGLGARLVRECRLVPSDCRVPAGARQPVAALDDAVRPLLPHQLSLDRRYPWAKWLVIGPVLFRVLGTNVVTDLLTLRHAAQQYG